MEQKLLDYLILHPTATLDRGFDEFKIKPVKRVRLLSNHEFMMAVGKITKYRQARLAFDCTASLAESVPQLNKLSKDLAKDADKLRAIADSASISFRLFALNDDVLIDTLHDTLEILNNAS